MARPRIVASTRSSPVLPLSRWSEVCEHIGIAEIDIDVAQSIRNRLLLRGFSPTLRATPRVYSVWIGARTLDLLASGLANGSLVIVPFDQFTTGRKSQSLDPTLIDALRREIPGTSRLALALTPVNHEGSRSHLDRISAIRHVAEEWDIDIALDLSGSIDPQWEAEAAVLRLGERLRIVRLSHLPPRVGPTSFDSPTMQEIGVGRVLSAVADFGLGPTISLRVTTPFWNWANPIAIAERFAVARDAIIARFRAKSGQLSTPPKRVG